MCGVQLMRLLDLLSDLLLHITIINNPCSADHIVPAGMCGVQLMRLLDLLSDLLLHITVKNNPCSADRTVLAGMCGAQLLRLLDLLADLIQPLDGSGSQALHHLQCLKLGPPTECIASSVHQQQQQQQQQQWDDDEQPAGWPEPLFQQLMQRLRGVPLLLQQLQVLELWGLNQQQQTQVGCNTCAWLVPQKRFGHFDTLLA
jgi:hypothetical protein